MTNPKGTRYRKGHFEIPYLWSESDKLRRRYRKGWFDARDIGFWGEGYGLANSRGRDAYIAGFNAGLNANPGASKRSLPGVFEIQDSLVVVTQSEPEPVLTPGQLPPPAPGDWHIPYLPPS